MKFQNMPIFQVLLISSLLVTGFNCLYANSSFRKSRVKRVGYGTSIEGRVSTGYSVILYLVWIGKGHDCDVSNWATFKSWFTGYCRVTRRNLKCNGALVAPKLVLTAGHCVATHGTGPHQGQWQRGVLKSHWENLFEVFMGLNHVDSFTRGIYSRKFLLHEKYVNLVRPDHVISYDFGWIILTKTPASFSDWAGFRFGLAPLYTQQTAKKIHSETLRLQAACLIIGFGRFSYDNYGPSEVLRHGYGMVMDYSDSQSFDRSHFRGAKLPFKYKKRATWSFLRPFGKHDEAIYSGDSGGPLTCNNYHFGVNQGDYRNRSPNPKWRLYVVSIVSGLVFLKFENTREYRRAFLQSVSEYAQKDPLPTA